MSGPTNPEPDRRAWPGPATGPGPAAATHLCPGRKGDHYPGPEVDAGKLACVRHWGMVTRPTQVEVYRAWDYGRGAGTKRHRDAVAAAIAEMNR